MWQPECTNQSNQAELHGIALCRQSVVWLSRSCGSALAKFGDTHGPSDSIPLPLLACRLCAPGFPFLVQQRMVRQGHLGRACCGASAGRLKLALFQIEAVAFPIAEGRLNPVAFAAATPCLRIDGQVQRPVTRGILGWRPIGDQVDRTKGTALIQVDALRITAVAALQTQLL